VTGLRALPANSDSVIPAQAGIHPQDGKTLKRLDSRPTLSRGQAFRGNDERGARRDFGAKPGLRSELALEQATQ
jgi:hypothetical protein